MSEQEINNKLDIEIDSDKDSLLFSLETEKPLKQVFNKSFPKGDLVDGVKNFKHCKSVEEIFEILAYLMEKKKCEIIFGEAGEAVLVFDDYFGYILIPLLPPASDSFLRSLSVPEKKREIVSRPLSQDEVLDFCQVDDSLFAVSLAKGIELYDSRTYERKFTIKPEENAKINYIEKFDDGYLMGCSSQKIYFWEIFEGEEPKLDEKNVIETGHNKPIKKAIKLRGNKIASCSESEIKIFENQKCLETFNATDPDVKILSIMQLKRRNYIVSIESNGLVSFWKKLNKVEKSIQTSNDNLARSKNMIELDGKIIICGKKISVIDTDNYSVQEFNVLNNADCTIESVTLIEDKVILCGYNTGNSYELIEVDVQNKKVLDKKEETAEGLIKGLLFLNNNYLLYWIFCRQRFIVKAWPAKN